MKKKNLSTQYNNSAKNYEELHTGENKKSTGIFLNIVLRYIEKIQTIEHERSLVHLLDLGCGSGTDFELYSKQRKVCCFGLDASQEMISLVEEKFPKKIILECEDFSQKNIRPFKGFHFQLIVSKWALQTAEDLSIVWENVDRLLVRDGYFIFLTVHPLRQFLEKKKSGKDYFKQEIVASEIFDKQITVYEPTHTMQDYLSPYFLEHFELLEIKEDYEFPAAEQIGGDIYPTHLIVVARKK